LYREGFNSEQYCLHWDGMWQAKASTLKQMMRTAARWHCVVTQQCPFSHCCPHYCNS
jgi:hypothetical protein